MMKATQGLSQLFPIATKFPEKAVSLDGIKAVIFDIYGTLLISGSGDIGVNEPVNTQEIYTSILNQFGISDPLMLIEDFKSAIKQNHLELKSQGVDYPEVDIREIWQRVLSDKNHGLPANIISELALAYENATNPTWPMPKAQTVLSELGKRGLKLGIVSNAQFCTKLLMEDFFGKDTFPGLFTESLCVYSFEQRRGKPSLPLFFPLIHEAQKLGIQAHEMLYVGNDMLNDIYTASKSGLRTVLFAGDQRSLRMREDHPLVQNIEPDGVITELSQILG